MTSVKRFACHEVVITAAVALSINLCCMFIK